LHRLEENIGATRIALTPLELGDIDRALATLTVHGERYPEHLQKLIDR
jgi:hypothetical protein